ncbi:hypothetical protein [Mycobacterium sp. 4858]|uniref:hypothetical protein n=1 Tax=Mycobacterium sp. 4858 TaxID=2057185 RepID=UPI003510630A
MTFPHRPPWTPRTSTASRHRWLPPTPPADVPPAPPADDFRGFVPANMPQEVSTVGYTKQLWDAIRAQDIQGNDALDAIAQPSPAT